MRSYAKGCFLQRLQQLIAIAFLAMAVETKFSAVTTSVEGKTMDLDTTLALSPEAFWKLAQSETFYRSSRMQEKNVSQKVVELSKWVSKVDQDMPDRTAFVLPGRDRLTSPQSQRLQRAASLVNSVTCPLGVIETQVQQDQTLTVSKDGIVTYTTVDSVKGVPLTKGNMIIHTMVDVVSKADNPDSVRVRVKVNVAEIRLPMMLRWLKGQMASSIKADGLKQANSWLDQMVEAKAEEEP